MGISSELSKAEQNKMSRSFRKIVKESCGVSLTQLWSWYKNHDHLDSMVESKFHLVKIFLPKLTYLV